MAEVVNCDTRAALPSMGIVFLVLLICSFIIYALVAFHSAVNTTPLFVEQWKKARDSLTEWRQSIGGSRGSISQGKVQVNPVTSLFLQLITVATMLRLSFVLALVIMTGMGLDVPCGSFMELPSSVSWLMMLHDVGTLLLMAVLGGFCFFWSEFERIANSSASIKRMVIDQWSKWSIAFCVFFTLIVLAVDVLYGFFNGTQVTLLHMGRELLLGYLSIYYGSRMLLLGGAVVRSTQFVVSAAAMKTRFLQRAGFGCTLVMGFIRVINAVLILMQPSWLTDFNVVAFAAYTAAEIAFIVSVDAIVQPSHLKDLQTKAKTNVLSLGAHRITQTFSSLMLGQIDSPKDGPNKSDSGSSKGLSLERRQDSMHGRKSSFSSSWSKPQSDASPASPMSPPSRPGSFAQSKTTSLEVPIESPFEKASESDDGSGTDVEEVVPFEVSGDVALTIRAPQVFAASAEEMKEAEGQVAGLESGKDLV